MYNFSSNFVIFLAFIKYRFVINNYHCFVIAVISCGEPEVPEDGYVVGYDFDVHSVIEFHCEPGHILKGNPTLQCQPSGEWDGQPPSCLCTYRICLHYL